MIKKTFLFSLFATSLTLLSAQTTVDSIYNGNNLAILLTLCVALAALIISVVNSFRISHNRKVSNVELINQKDDLNVTMEAVQVKLSKDFRNLRKELGKNTRPHKPFQKNAPQEDKKENKTEEASEKEEPKRKPYKRRPSNYRRRPSNKKDTEKNTEETK